VETIDVPFHSTNDRIQGYPLAVMIGSYFSFHLSFHDYNGGNIPTAWVVDFRVSRSYTWKSKDAIVQCG
jgi:hypothetical protein